jgi:hypothetical protein
MPTEIDRKGLSCNKSANKMKQFTDFTFMKSMDLGSKADMSYRLRMLLNEKIDLAHYGGVVQSVLFSPLIGSFLSPESQYVSQEKQLIVEFDIDPQQAIDLAEAPYFQLMLDSFLQAMEDMDLPEGFDFETFKKDVSALQFEQLQQAA